MQSWPLALILYKWVVYRLNLKGLIVIYVLDINNLMSLKQGFWSHCSCCKTPVGLAIRATLHLDVRSFITEANDSFVPSPTCLNGPIVIAPCRPLCPLSTSCRNERSAQKSNSPTRRRQQAAFINLHPMCTCCMSVWRHGELDVMPMKTIYYITLHYEMPATVIQLVLNTKL